MKEFNILHAYSFFSWSIPSASPIDDGWVTFQNLNGLCKITGNINSHKDAIGTYISLGFLHRKWNKDWNKILASLLLPCILHSILHRFAGSDKFALIQQAFIEYLLWIHHCTWCCEYWVEKQSLLVQKTTLPHIK